MKLLDAFISFVFSIIILALSLAVILVLTGLADVNVVYDTLKTYVFGNEYFNISLITSVVLCLASLKTTVFSSRLKAKDNKPITVETENGNVEIAQETITGTVRSVAMTLENVKDINARMIKKNKGIKIYATLSVLANTNIRELTEKLQAKVIEVIKETTGVKVLSVNVKVKNIYDRASKKASVPVNSNIPEKEIVVPAPVVEGGVLIEEVTENQDTNKEE